MSTRIGLDEVDDDGRREMRVSPKDDADRGCDVAARLPLPEAAAVPEPRRPACLQAWARLVETRLCASCLSAKAASGDEAEMDYCD